MIKEKRWWYSMAHAIFCDNYNILIVGSDYKKVFNVNSRETEVSSLTIPRINIIQALALSYQKVPYSTKIFKDNFNFTTKADRVFGRHNDYMFTIPYDRKEETRIR